MNDVEEARLLILNGAYGSDEAKLAGLAACLLSRLDAIGGEMTGPYAGLVETNERIIAICSGKVDP